MLGQTVCANRSASKIRAKVERVFAELKYRMGLAIQTIGIKRAQTRIGLVNLVYNMKRLRFWKKRATDV
ncbi:Transposase DDE domain-containing protein [Nitrosomonas sp. Nm166]|nr:Transposase DDE domain-containing protein [Nitrosomonas sp. Nm166]